MDYSVKADLRTFPHFYSPQDKPNVPSLAQMVESWERNGLGIVSLTACHSMTAGIDNRFEDYMKHLPALANSYKIDDRRNEGFIAVQNRMGSMLVRMISPVLSQVPLIILNSQQVRSYFGDQPVDLNVIGAPKIIQPSREIEEVIKEARDLGCIITACHIEDKCGLSLSDALYQLSCENIDAIEREAKENPTVGEEIGAALGLRRIKPLPVTGGHSYKQAGTSYAMFERNLAEDFSIGKLREAIADGHFDTHYGHISRLSKFLSRDIHILKLFPKQYLTGGKIRKELLKAIGLKKK